jgi:undecaprenyl-diphosphatase
MYAWNMSDLLIKFIADWLVIVVVLVGGIGFLVLVKKDRYKTVAWGLMTALIALLLAKIASLFYQGQRPFELLGLAPKAAFLNNPGFPSDHALLVFTVTLVVWASTKNVALSLTLLVMSILVAVGRVAALVHTPIDVLGSIACALLAATLVYGKRLYTFK